MATNSSANTNTSFDASRSSSTSESIDIGGSRSSLTPVTKSKLANPGDTCSWYSGGECHLPRTCRDCINVALANDECAVNPSGMCVSMTSYVRELAQQRGALGELGFNGFFPSVNFSYCSEQDTACITCKNAWSNEYWSKNQVLEPSVCYGANGCVCLSSCEAPNHDEVAIANGCTLFGIDRSKLVTGAYVGAGVFSALVVLFIMLRSRARKRREQERAQEIQEYRECRERRRERTRERLRDRLTSKRPLLGLGGWNSLRAKLLASEQEQLGGDKVALEEPGVEADSD